MSILKSQFLLPVVSSLVTLVAMYVYNKRTKDKDISNKSKYIIGTSYVVVLLIINLFIYNKYFCNTVSINKKINIKRTRTSKTNNNIPLNDVPEELMSGGGGEDIGNSDMYAETIDTAMPDF